MKTKTNALQAGFALAFTSLASPHANAGVVSYAKNAVTWVTQTYKTVSQTDAYKCATAVGSTAGAVWNGTKAVLTVEVPPVSIYYASKAQFSAVSATQKWNDGAGASCYNVGTSVYNSAAGSLSNAYNNAANSYARYTSPQAVQSYATYLYFVKDKQA